MYGGVWWATVHGVTKSWTQLNNFTSLLLYCRQMFYHLSHQEAEKSLGYLNLKAEQIGFADGLITGYEREKSRVTIVKNYLNNVGK